MIKDTKEINLRKQVALENAKDYLYYWYWKKARIENGHNAWLDEDTSNEIWKQAIYLLTK